MLQKKMTKLKIFKNILKTTGFVFLTILGLLTLVVGINLWAHFHRFSYAIFAISFTSIFIIFLSIIIYDAISE